MSADCETCNGTGWITLADWDGSGYDVDCPDCDGPPLHPDDDGSYPGVEVPF